MISESCPCAQKEMIVKIYFLTGWEFMEVVPWAFIGTSVEVEKLWEELDMVGHRLSYDNTKSYDFYFAFCANIAVALFNLTRNHYLVTIQSLMNFI